ncbi:hypothetical protein [Salmonirosea aquatica]|uniref:hypothetical protein n=1 Tax=Salmonirosea aquatica TaxID=2654236 RepID=UPI003570D8C1
MLEVRLGEAVEAQRPRGHPAVAVLVVGHPFQNEGLAIGAQGSHHIARFEQFFEILMH